MNRTLRRFAIGTAAAVVLLLGGVAATVQMRWDRTFEAPYPTIAAAQADSATLARGEYLVYGPGHCVSCHVGSDEIERAEAGERLPLAGGFAFHLPVGTFYTPNITPDSVTGIGRRTDAELARMLRVGVRHDGRAALPFMETQQLADADIAALIAYLRAQPAVRREVPAHEFNFAGRAVSAFVLAPAAPRDAPPAAAPPESATVARGEYMANSVANCVGCHTDRSLMTGAFTGPRFAGGMEMPSDLDPTMIFAPPNLTPHPRTGAIAGWTEDQFVARFREGRRIRESPMPWQSFGRMSDADLRAIYRYLRALPAVENETGPRVRRTDG